MKAVLVLGLALLVALAAAEDVITLTESNFESTLKQHDLAVVEFFAPWCGHCKRLAPEYEKAAGILKKSDTPVALAAVDATEHGSLASRFGVTGYPTLKIFRKGELSADYQGPRDAAGIVKYMEKQAGPSSKRKCFLIDNASMFSSLDSGMARAFLKTADAERENFRFAHTTQSKALGQYGKDVVVVFRPQKLSNKFEEGHVVYSGKAKNTLIKEFIMDAITSPGGIMTPDHRPFFFASKPLLVVYYDLDVKMNPSRAKYIRNRVLKVAQDVTSDLTIAVANKADFAQDVQQLGLDEFSVAAGIWGEGSTKYRLDEEWSMDAMRQFIADFEADKLESHVKSEANPEPDGDVVVATGKTIDEILNAPGKDVLIEAYAPWCGHCKKLAPVFSELATKFKDEDSVTVAKIDATANDLPASLPVSGYPSIFWVPADSKKPEKYSGGRELKDFTQFIKSRASGLSKKVKDEL
ncbi:uncharacterized protein MONBRDRAFT_27243 [Monosiga brevicollis MX1]|uniref:Protein disulfide-isomerase n=1 Tax=Monosiga brevicollis TaxID=81824 RepID=A9V4Q6_MONBE|nr:uncharacterized protein MONBRDRAFT_27243 [Monosiga brevicollis MX1]EDQ87496.1 predicted protein [Monosiga brevicollis MX1]|eukprot:XP_001747756.1 hypothetical protein [Monosiga brevicollis MX1]